MKVITTFNEAQHTTFSLCGDDLTSKRRSFLDVQATVEKHLSPLDSVVSDIYAQHTEYFE